MKTTPPNTTAQPRPRSLNCRQPPARSADRPRRSVLLGYLLRVAAQHPESALADRAAQTVDRLELHALERVIGLLDPAETRLLAHLMLAPPRRTRARALHRAALASLVSAADDAEGLAFLRELGATDQRLLLAALGPRRATYEKALARTRPAAPWDALRLRRLFTR